MTEITQFIFETYFIREHILIISVSKAQLFMKVRTFWHTSKTVANAYKISKDYVK